MTRAGYAKFVEERQQALKSALSTAQQRLRAAQLQFDAAFHDVNSNVDVLALTGLLKALEDAQQAVQEAQKKYNRSV